MLDTNIVIHALRKHPAVLRHIARVPSDETCISAITAGEISFGFARSPTAHGQRVAFRELLGSVTVLPWNQQVADTYGLLRAELVSVGRSLSPLDLLIAAHALALGAVLVTNDQAMLRQTGLETEDWTRDV
jgi:tRNA(fMet)-specific endonuclease VapC